jgi:all-trans-retinol dehydrogenase (NAD+)
MRNLQNKVVLITGAGGGIGRAIAGEFAAAGAKLVLTDLPNVISQLKRDFPDALVLALDVTDAKSIARAREEVQRKLGAVHVLINNAGTVFGGAFARLPFDKHRFTFELNTIAPAAMTHAFPPGMLNTESHLVYIASASGFIGLPYGSTYAASKWGLIGFAESIRNELNAMKLPVSVSIICPSYVDTGLFEGARGALAYSRASARGRWPSRPARRSKEASLREDALGACI